MDLASKIQPLAMKPVVSEHTGDQFELINHLDKENSYLKAKCKQLEERCRNMEKKLTSQENTRVSNSNTYSSAGETATRSEITRSSGLDKLKQPRPSVYPPLKVRLQKLNEKSVALKWNHNPKNSLIDLSGYNVYINNDLLATMAPNDKIASIDGMKEEGEYQIYITAVCDRVESEKSNTVITRVKKKANDSLSKIFVDVGTVK